MNKYQELLDRDGFVIITPIGNSMWPMLRNRKDSVKIIKVQNLHKYDVILYRRNSGELILHRIIGIKNGVYLVCGDRQTTIEYVNKDIIGVVAGFYRQEKYISVDRLGYKLYCRLWVFTRPLRKLISRIRRVML